jgi:hypothetical protein
MKQKCGKCIRTSMKVIERSLFCAGLALLTLMTCTAADSPAAAAPAPGARVDGARIFPFFAGGGGWESTILLSNIADATSNYRLLFFSPTGQPAQVTYRGRDARITSAQVIEGSLNDDGSDRIDLIDTGLLQTGWARIENDGDNRIAGVLVFRQKVNGRPDFEAAVPLSRDDENRFWFPFDNTQGFATTLAMTNSSTSDSTDLKLRFWDADGREILTRDLRMSAGTTVAFSLAEQYPELRGQTGTARVEGSGSKLSGLALRFNPSGAFTMVPVASR